MEVEQGEPHFSSERAAPGDGNPDSAMLRAILRVPVTVKVIVGSAVLPVSELTALRAGSVLPLDRKIGDKVDVVANGKVIARGSIVVIDEDASRFAVSIEEIAGR